MSKKRKELVEYPTKIRKANYDDIPFILKIAHQYPKELGFVRRVSLEDSLKRDSLYVADYFDSVCVGFVNFRTRKDGWTVIYEISTHKDFLRKGIASFLLNSVPFPVRLKCPVDNESNKFYAQEGMTLENVEQGRKRNLNVWSKKRAIILCKGSSPSVLSTVKQTSLLYGSRHTEKPLLQPFMIDIKWDKYEWVDYIKKLKAYKPVLALAPDFMSLEQLPVLLEQIQKMRDLGILKIAVCPKFIGAVQHIPKDCLIAVSIPSSYAGFIPPYPELVERQIHLLGGSPQAQLAFMKVHENVVSVDINSHTNAARYGTIYDGEANKWKYNEFTKQYKYEQRILLSSQNIEGALYDA